LSLNAKYELHIVPIIERYRGTDGRRALTRTRTTCRNCSPSSPELGGPAQFAARVGNQQRTSTHDGAPLKAEAVHAAAVVFADAGLNMAGEWREARTDLVEPVHGAWRTVPG
jgi:hypothetical protein